MSSPQDFGAIAVLKNKQVESESRLESETVFCDENRSLRHSEDGDVVLSPSSELKKFPVPESTSMVASSLSDVQLGLSAAASSR